MLPCTFPSKQKLAGIFIRITVSRSNLMRNDVFTILIHFFSTTTLWGRFYCYPHWQMHPSFAAGAQKCKLISWRIRRRGVPPRDVLFLWHCLELLSRGQNIKLGDCRQSYYIAFKFSFNHALSYSLHQGQTTPTALGIPLTLSHQFDSPMQNFSLEMSGVGKQVWVNSIFEWAWWQTHPGF